MLDERMPAGPFGDAGAAFVPKKGDVQGFEAWEFVTIEQASQQELTGGRTGEVVPSDHGRDSLKCVINGDCELVGPMVVATLEHKIPHDFMDILAEIPEATIPMDDGVSRVSLQSDGGRAVGSICRGRRWARRGSACFGIARTFVGWAMGG